MPFYFIYYEQVYSSRGGVAHGTGDVNHRSILPCAKTGSLREPFSFEQQKL